eukprot:6283-Heterococcus_DN1.PRE.5
MGRQDPYSTLALYFSNPVPAIDATAESTTTTAADAGASGGLEDSTSAVHRSKQQRYVHIQFVVRFMQGPGQYVTRVITHSRPQLMVPLQRPHRVELIASVWLRLEPEAPSNPLSLQTVDQDATAVLLAKAAVRQAMPPADAVDTYESRKAHADKASLDFESDLHDPHDCI